MPSSTGPERGEIVLVRFVFADGRGAKRRPVVALSDEDYHARRVEVIVAALTTPVGRLPPGDHLVERWKDAGLPRPSVVTGILRTIRHDMIDAPFGHLTEEDRAGVDACLRPVLRL